MKDTLHAGSWANDSYASRMLYLEILLLINFRPQTGKVANVILAGTGDDSDDAEEFLVEEKPKDQLDLIAEASANTTQADVSKSDLTRERGYVR